MEGWRVAEFDNLVRYGRAGLYIDRGLKKCIYSEYGVGKEGGLYRVKIEDESLQNL